MKNAFLVCVALTIMFCAPSLSSASLVNNGDTIIVADGPGAGSGGSFKIENVTTASGPDLFRTFCIERNEFLSFGPSYYTTLEDRAIFGGSGVLDIGGAGSAGTLGVFDPLSPLTAWLYSKAIGGTLAGYSAGSDSDNDALQDAIWYIENENDTLAAGLATTYYTAATTAAPTTIGNVRVMNLWTSAGAAYTDEGKVQSLLVVVPEAATIAVWSVLSLLGLAAFRVSKLVAGITSLN